MIPRVTRRLNDFERRTMVKSGAVFIFSVEESGIKRWTEGLAWSQSRISGNFLVGVPPPSRPPPSHGTVLTLSSALSGGRRSDYAHQPADRGPAHVPTPRPSTGTTAELQAPRAREEGELVLSRLSSYERLKLTVNRLLRSKLMAPTITSFHITPRRTSRPVSCAGQQAIQISWQSKSRPSSRGPPTSDTRQISRKPMTQQAPTGELFAQITT